MTLIPLNYHSPVACDAFVPERTTRPGAITWATVWAAAWLLFAGIAFGQTRPATAPATQPVTMPVVLATDAALQNAFNRLRGGETLTLHSGNHYTLALGRKAVHNVTITTDGDDYAYFDIKDTLGLTLLLANDWTLHNLYWNETGRNPDGPGFVKKPGHNGAQLTQCNGIRFLHCGWAWWFDDVSAEGAGQRGPQFIDCYFGPSYAVRLPSGQDPHAQGVYLNGQLGTTFTVCKFYLSGWNPKVNDPAAAANQLCHAIYSHDGNKDPQPALSGPYTASDCVFIDAASCGPTADTGAILNSCIFVNCAHDGGARNAWVGGDYSEVRNCLSIGGSIDFIAKAGKILNNTVYTLPAVSPFTLDIPHGHPNPRLPTDLIEFGGNVAYGWAGSPLKVWVNGGTLNDHGDNLSLPANDMLAKLLTDGAKLKAGIK